VAGLKREKIGFFLQRHLCRVTAVIDEFGNSTEQAYTGWPDRLYLIDVKGHIAYKAKPGPFGFKAEELRAALGRLVN